MSLRKLVLVGWDAADWKVIRPLVYAGKMPNVRRLLECGASGSIATLHPPLSPMLWTSIATGKRPFKHGIHGFSEPTADGRGVQPVTNLSRKCKAVWNLLEQNGLRSTVVGWWPSHPAEPIDGVMVSDRYSRAHRPLAAGWPLPASAVHPPELAQTLADLRVHPDQITPELVEPFVPLAREIDQDQDRRLGTLLRTLAECLSIQAAALWLIANRPWDFFAVYFDSIDHFSHGFMRYHPPRQDWIAERDFELYHHVISAAYQLHDQMLGALLERAGGEVAVMLVSDHGFHPDHLRPAAIPGYPAGPAVEHRDLGIFAMSSPGIANRRVVHGASILDVTPTILAFYGLPSGEDMDGKVLSQAFAENQPVRFLPSWENVPGRDGRHPPHTLLDPVAAHEALEQMVALGYIAPLDENRKTAVEKTIRELRYNLAEAYQDAGRHHEAREILGELRAADREELRFAVRLADSCLALGAFDEVRQIVDGGDVPPRVAESLQARLRIAAGNPREALDLLEPARSLETAALYLRLHRLSDAQNLYRAALAEDPDQAAAYLGLSRIALRRGEFPAAIEAALEALERDHHLPLAHFLLGVALSRQKKYPAAAEAFRAALSLNPNFPQAHLRLANLLERYLGDAESAREHRELAREMKRGEDACPRRSSIDFRPLKSDLPACNRATPMPKVEESLIVVTGLPRSGTSLIMQMLVAGRVEILADYSRPPDEDNPRGYFELPAVRDLFRDAKCLEAARGKAVKIVVPLLGALPPEVPCRVIFCERDLDEVLDSQERMLRHRREPLPDRSRRERLRAEYGRALDRARRGLAARAATAVLHVDYHDALSRSFNVAREIREFVSAPKDAAEMAAAVHPALYRNRAARSA